MDSEETTCEREQSVPTTLDAGALFLASAEDSVAVLDTGTTANLARFRWIEHHDRPSGKRGRRGVSIFPSSARFRFRFRDGHLGDVRHSADIPVGIAGNQGKFIVCASRAPALGRLGGTGRVIGFRAGFVDSPQTSCRGRPASADPSTQTGWDTTS